MFLLKKSYCQSTSSLVLFLFFGMTNKIITVTRLIPTLMSTCIFSVITDKDLPARNLNDNLNRTNNCAFQWKKKVLIQILAKKFKK